MRSWGRKNGKNGEENIRNSWDISFEDIRRIILKTSKRHEIVTSLKETLGTKELFSSILQPWDRKREENKRVKWKKRKEKEWCSIVATREKNDEILLISGAKAVRDLFFHYFSTNGTVCNNASRYVLTYVYVWFNHNETAISSTWYWYLVQLVNHIALQNTRLRSKLGVNSIFLICSSNIPRFFFCYFLLW